MEVGEKKVISIDYPDRSHPIKTLPAKTIDFSVTLTAIQNGIS